ncbi:MAG: DedA family protein [Candidatus Paceibacterota bacterium]|jgi:membrane-associated protein
MDILLTAVDFFLHLDKYLGSAITAYGNLTYGLLFLIIFCETGLVVTPILPGDSLIFAAGALSAGSVLSPIMLFILLAAAAIMGDSVNYSIGRFFGVKILEGKTGLIKEKHLRKSQAFYDKHGGKTIIIARFVPIVRTFAPFLAGLSHMNYSRFIAYNFIGGIAWVGLFVFGGYYFGNLPVVRENFSFVIFAIIFVSLLPPAIDFLRHKWFNKESI